MKKIVLVSCVKKKLEHKAKARDLYISSLCRYTRTKVRGTYLKIKPSLT